MIELPEGICYSPHPPDDYVPPDVKWMMSAYMNDLSEWNMLWLTQPILDGALGLDKTSWVDWKTTTGGLDYGLTACMGATFKLEEEAGVPKGLSLHSLLTLPPMDFLRRLKQREWWDMVLFHDPELMKLVESRAHLSAGLEYVAERTQVADAQAQSTIVEVVGNVAYAEFRGANKKPLACKGRPLGALNDNAISAATSSPAKEAPVAIQVETLTDMPTNGKTSGHFIDNGDGTVTDTRTGLMWMRCALGQTWDGTTCIRKAKWYTWGEAKALRHDFADYNDWRLPSIDELKSIIDDARGRPTIDTAAFPNTSRLFFWSGSPNVHNSNLAWYVCFSHDGGYASNIGRDHYHDVRLVRGGLAHFVGNDNGTVMDTSTGMMWMRCALGQTWDGIACVGEPQKFTWGDAMALHHSFAGHDDWRLPEAAELKNIIDKTQVGPFHDVIDFPKDLGFWSKLSEGVASSREPGAGSYLVFSGRDYTYRIRLVRGGQFLGALTDGAISKATSSLARVECMNDAQASEKPIVRAAIDFIRQHPELFAAEISELRAFLGEPFITPVEAVISLLPEPQTLTQIIAWLATLEMVTISDLRTQLLPLDLLPSAVIDDLNERALDLTGDLALEEDGEQFIIVREVLAQVVSAWHQSCAR